MTWRVQWHWDISKFLHRFQYKWRILKKIEKCWKMTLFPWKHFHVILRHSRNLKIWLCHCTLHKFWIPLMYSTCVYHLRLLRSTLYKMVKMLIFTSFGKSQETTKECPKQYIFSQFGYNWYLDSKQRHSILYFMD
jgi:hypothetical protein